MSYLIFSILFLLPLLVFPWGASFFETPKVIVGEVLIELILAIIFITNTRLLKSFNKFQLAILFLIIVLSVVHLVFLRTNTTFFGNTFRLQGIFLLWNLLIFSLISSKIKLKIPFKQVFFILLLVLLIPAVFLVNSSGRGLGTLGEPNALAATAVFLWPFMFFRQNKILGKVKTAVLALIIILFSGSRSGLVAFSAQIIFISLNQKLKLPINKSFVAALVVLVLSLVLPFIEGGGWYENRAEIWQTALAAGFKNPIFGAGFGNMEKILPEVSKQMANNIQYQYIDSAHNLFLDWWVQAGLLGVLALCALIFKTFNNFIKTQKTLEITLLLGVVGVMLFNPVSVVTLIAFWWLIGLGFASFDNLG